MILASIGADRRATDPEPWVYPDGTRHAHLTDPAAEYPLPDVAAVEYAPRPQHLPSQHNPVNPILDAARDNWDDPWGSALAWGFAVASAADHLGSSVPDSLGYRPSIGGSSADLAEGSWEACEVIDRLGIGTIAEDPEGNGAVVTLTDLDALEPEVLERAIAYADHALRVLERVMDAVPEADRY